MPRDPGNQAIEILFRLYQSYIILLIDKDEQAEKFWSKFFALSWKIEDILKAADPDRLTKILMDLRKRAASVKKVKSVITLVADPATHPMKSIEPVPPSSN